MSPCRWARTTRTSAESIGRRGRVARTTAAETLPAARRLISLFGMRNPVRLKNFNLRFGPLYVIGVVILVEHQPDASTLAAALPMLVIGALLRGWGAGHLVKNDVLTTTGPYAHVRHPLYLGTILIGTGFAIAIGGVWTLLILAGLWPWFALVYFPRKERVESERLERLYGEQFSRYRAAVPALWPCLRAWRDNGESPMPRRVSAWAIARYSENNELGTLLAVCVGWLVFWFRATGLP